MIRRLSASQLAQIALTQPEASLSLRGIQESAPDLPAIPGYVPESAPQIPHSDSFGDRAAVGIRGALDSLPPVSRYIGNGDAFGQSFVRGLASGFAEPRLENMAESARVNANARQQANERNKMRMADEQDASKSARDFGYNLRLKEAEYGMKPKPPTLSDIRAESKARTEGSLAGSGMSGLSPAARTMLANATASGDFSALALLGRGGVADRVTVLNEAAKQDPNLAQEHATLQGEASSLKSLQKSHDSLSAFLKMGERNVGRLKAIMKTIPDAGAPWLNAPLRSIDKNLLGSKDVATYNAAVSLIDKEFARITTQPNLTGQLTDESQKELKELAGHNLSVNQMLDAIDRVLLPDSKSRVAALESEIATVKAGIGTRETSTGSHLEWTKDANGKSVGKMVPD